MIVVWLEPSQLTLEKMIPRLLPNVSWSPGHHCVIYRHKQPFTLKLTPTGNLELSINLRRMSSLCGRKWKYREETHTDTGRTCKLHTERPLEEQGNIEPSCCT